MKNYMKEIKALEKTYSTLVRQTPTTERKFFAQLTLAMLFTGLAGFQTMNSTDLNERRLNHELYERRKQTLLKAFNLLKSSQRFDKKSAEERSKHTEYRAVS